MRIAPGKAAIAAATRGIVIRFIRPLPFAASEWEGGRGVHSRPVKEGGKCAERLFGSGFMSIECVFDSQAEGDIIADACLYTRIFPNCRPPP